jgi:hypothetical protein
MKETSATFTSKSQLQPITEDYVDRVMGCLADGLDLLAKWEIEHRQEGEHEQ